MLERIRKAMEKMQKNGFLAVGALAIFFLFGGTAFAQGMTPAQSQYEKNSIEECTDAATRLGNSPDVAKGYCQCAFSGAFAQIPDAELPLLRQCVFPGPNAPAFCAKAMAQMQAKAKACAKGSSVPKTNFLSSGVHSCKLSMNLGNSAVPEEKASAYCTCALGYVADRLDNDEIIESDFAVREGKTSPAMKKMWALRDKARAQCLHLLGK
jgi:hypothetical protein